jgi:hypothetical protein
MKKTFIALLLVLLMAACRENSHTIDTVYRRSTSYHKLDCWRQAYDDSANLKLTDKNNGRFEKAI